MPRAKLDSKNNKVINGLMIIGEAFKNADINDDDLLDTCVKIDFIHYFEGIEDFRNADMITYKLQNILLLAFLVILSRGVNSFNGIASYVRFEKEKYEKYGLIENGKCPSHDTFRRVFELLDARSVYENTIERLYEFLTMIESEILNNNVHKQIMVDGKEVRGSGRSTNSKNPKRNVQILNIYDGSLKTCIHSELIDEKTNEIPVAQRYLEHMNLKHVVVTADALHCQRETAKIISKKKGIYVLTVKENQPLLLEEINTRIDKFKDKARTVKREKRTFELLDLPASYATDGFTGMKKFVRMSSSTHNAKKKDSRCFISNSKDDDLVIEAIENRWEIENGLHKEKDSMFKEDEFRSSYRNTVLNVALLNNLALQLVKIFHAISGLSYHDAKIYMQLHPMEGISKICSVMNSPEIIETIKTEIKKIKKYRSL